MTRRKGAIMKYGIIVDSGCDLYEYEKINEQIGFERVPLKIELGEQEIVEDGNLHGADLLEQIEAWDGKSTTAAPAPEEWRSAFDRYDITFAITITGGMSGSVRSAYAAKDMILEQKPEKEIYIIDSLSTGPEIVLLMDKIMHLISCEMSAKQIMEEIQEYQHHTHLSFMLAHLDHLVKNGRVSKAQGLMAGILGIQIIGHASEQGELEIDEKIRGKKKIADSFMKMLKKYGYQGGNAVISHCMNLEQAENLRQKILKMYPQARITIMEAGGLCSYYMQREGVLIGFEDL